jgi:hypothetical protein
MGHSPILRYHNRTHVGRRRCRRRGPHPQAHEGFNDRTQLSSTPPTRTAILSGNGETSELVIGGTAARPCSDEVCASIVRRLFESVAAMFLSNCWRSAWPTVQQKDGAKVCNIRTLFGLGLAYLRVDDPVCFRWTWVRRLDGVRTIVPMQLPPASGQAGSVDSNDNRGIGATCLVCGHSEPRLPLVLLRKRDRNLNTTHQLIHDPRKRANNKRTHLSPFQRDALEALPKRIHLLLDDALHIRIRDARLYVY